MFLTCMLFAGYVFYLMFATIGKNVDFVLSPSYLEVSGKSFNLSEVG